jgi:hypothetical protein
MLLEQDAVMLTEVSDEALAEIVTVNAVEVGIPAVKKTVEGWLSVSVT